MKQGTLTLFAVLFSILNAFSKEKPKPEAEIDSAQIMMDAYEKGLTYQTGEVKIGDNLAKLKVPAGFKFLNAADAQKVVYEIWGNPRDKEEKMYGMLIPEKMKATGQDSWAFIIEYDDMGFVKDDDADKINYAEMLKEMQDGEKEENAERVKAGFGAVHIVGWAEQPHYDKTRKVLHWAKEIDFDGTTEHTLNYNVRVLGRKGIIMLNAVGNISQLGEIKQTIDGVLSSVEYNEGNRYSDFNPSVDKVAAWTIGGLVAGKVLAKVGILAMIAKFGKVIFLAIGGGAAAIWRFMKRATGRGGEEQA